MKQAILITGYKDTYSIIDIINILDSNFNFYIHIDKKSNLDLSALNNYKNVFVFNKYKVNWGGVNHLKAILLLVKTSLKNAENSYFHLISAEDYPMRSIKDFCQLDTSKNCLEFFELPAKSWLGNGGMDRIDYYNFYDLLNAKNELQLKIIKNFIKIQKYLRIKRGNISNLIKLYGGSTYWSLNRSMLQYVIDYTKQNKKFLRRFNHTFCAEEIYFQTIILNSSYANTVINNNLRYIDWDSGRGGFPAFLDENDFNDIILSNKFFARKINDSVSSKLKHMITNYLQKQDNKAEAGQ